jgi:hypothetical protein
MPAAGVTFFASPKKVTHAAGKQSHTKIQTQLKKSIH